MKKRILCIILSLAMVVSCLAVSRKTDAATFDDVNQSSVFLKQQTSYTCTLVSAVMMVRRAAMMSGNNNWSSITESSMRGTAWNEGYGLWYNFTYSGITVKHSTLPTGSSNTNTLISLLASHPEGIVIYYTGCPHAVLLTDYTNGAFFAADPSSGAASGRISIGNVSGGVTISNVSEYWYVSSPSVSLTSNRPSKATLKNISSSSSSPTSFTEGNDVNLSWDATTNTTHYSIGIDKLGSDGKYAFYKNVLEIKGTSTTLKDLPIGTYKINLVAYNSNYYEGSDWLHADYDFNYFSVNHNVVTDKAVAATCTTTGLTEGSHCSVCKTVIKKQEVTKALGHNYCLVSADADCTTVTGHYECANCHDKKDVTSGEGKYYEWSAEKPSGIDENKIETKTQYSSQKRETKYSTESSLTGWTKVSGNQRYTEYGNWSAWTQDTLVKSDLMDVETATIYRYYAFVCPNCGCHDPYTGACSNCGVNLTTSHSECWWSNVSYSQAYVGTYGKPYTESNTNIAGGARAYFSEGNRYSTSVPTQDSDSDAIVIDSGFRCRTRSIEYLYERWVDGLSWQDEIITSDENTKVSTRTLYRYKVDPAGHSFSETYNNDADYHWKKCQNCEEISEKTAHVYDNDQDTNCNICGYVREVTPITPPVNPPIDETDPQIIVESKTVKIGKEFTVTVNLKNNPGVAYLEVTPSYSSVFSFVSVSNGELISDFSKGKQYVWVADEDVTQDGLLLTFTFTTDEQAAPGEYEIGFIFRNGVNYSEEKVAFAVVPGTIELIDFVYGDANGDGSVDGMDIVRLKKYLSNFDYESMTSSIEINPGADANGDGTIDGLDVIRLKKYLANYDYESGTSTIKLGE